MSAIVTKPELPHVSQSLQEPGQSHETTQTTMDASSQPAHPQGHVFLCSDEQDLRPLLAAINSTATNCRNPESLTFHVLVPQSIHKPLEEAMARWFPHVTVDIDSKSLDENAITKRIAFFAAAGARKELANPYNFASFYLAENYRHLPRIIYLDTDVIVQGDVLELAEMDLHGHPMAAVGDCSQRCGPRLIVTTQPVIYYSHMMNG